MGFRFVHTADVHLDSPLRSLAFRNADLARLVETATRTAFARTIDLCIESDAEALVIAGDLYDGATTSMKTAAFLAAELERLAAADIRCFIVRGNHDAASAITRQLDLPATVHAFSGRADAIQFEARDGTPVAVHGLSFRERHAPESLLPKYGPPLPDHLNIGLMHTSLDGAPGHDPYAPTSLASLQAHGFDYWALGHIHQRGVHANGRILMPGIPQGRHINEAGPKSVTLVDLDAASASLTEHVVAEAEFARLDITVAGDLAAIRAALGDGIAAARANSAADHLILRLSLMPDAETAFRARRDVDLIQAAAQEVAARQDRTWIEKTEVQAPAQAASVGSDDTGPQAELEACMAAALAAPSFQAAAIAAVEAMAGDLPPELRDALGATPEALAARTQALAAAGGAEALAALLRPEEAPD